MRCRSLCAEVNHPKRIRRAATVARNVIPSVQKFAGPMTKRVAKAEEVHLKRTKATTKNVAVQARLPAVKHAANPSPRSFKAEQDHLARIARNVVAKKKLVAVHHAPAASTANVRALKAEDAHIHRVSSPRKSSPVLKKIAATPEHLNGRLVSVRLAAVVKHITRLSPSSGSIEIPVAQYNLKKIAAESSMNPAEN